METSQMLWFINDIWVQGKEYGVQIVFTVFLRKGHHNRTNNTGLGHFLPSQFGNTKSLVARCNWAYGIQIAAVQPGSE